MTKERFVELINRYKEASESLNALNESVEKYTGNFSVLTSPFDSLFVDAIAEEFEDKETVYWWLYETGDKIVEVDGVSYNLTTAEELYDFLTTQKWNPIFNRPKILLDCDDVINDFTGYICSVHNERTGDNLSPDSFTTWELKSYIPEYMDIMTEKGFFEGIPEKKNSIAALQWLIKSAKYDVYVITACQSNQELQEKFNWFDKYLPDFNKNRIISCKEKEMIRGDVLVDDKVENLDLCSPFMKCIVLDMPSNKECKYPRAASLGEVIPLLEEWFYN